MKIPRLFVALGGCLLLSSGCGGPSKFSFAQMSVDQTAASTNQGPGGANNPGGGNGGGTGSGGSGSTSGASSSGSGTPTSSPSSTPTLTCDSSHTLVSAHYKCHAGGAGTSMDMHCMFRSADDDHGECDRDDITQENDDQDLDLHAVAWFVPGTAADASTAGCAAEQAGSLLARVNNLPLTPSTGCGRYHFRGRVDLCVPSPLPTTKKDRYKAIVTAFLAQMAASNGAVTVNDDSARAGGKKVSLDNSGAVVNPSYCIKTPGCDQDRDNDPTGWLMKLGLRDWF